MTNHDAIDPLELRYFKLIDLRWEHAQNAFIVTVWILIASVAKILFHANKKFSTIIPDSACLIIVGLIFGFILVPLGIDPKIYDLTPDYFFLFLLYPIIFDAGYFMPSRQLFKNLNNILLFAFVGTIFNTAAIGGTLFACEKYGFFGKNVHFNIFEIFLFASLISAVDPVAVIAVFEEIHVNEFLFINVFGEALFNDGAAVVLYNIFKQFIEIGDPKRNDYIFGGLSSIIIIFGGIFIGLFFAVIASLITTYDRHNKYLAPLFIFALSYLAYLTAEIFGVSSIFALVICGMAMKPYVKENVTADETTTIKYFTKLISQSSEAVIFIFLGISAAVKVKTNDIDWNSAFIGITIAACIFYRSMGVIIQCVILNRFNTKKFSFSDMFVLSFGGLRGAIAFGLVSSISPDIKAKSLFVTTTMAVIFFTVFIQGCSIKPILTCLNVKLEDEPDNILKEQTFDYYFGHTMSGIESVVGRKGWNFLRQWYESLNAKILKPLLTKNYKRQKHDSSQIIRAYQKITLQEAMDILQSGQRPLSSMTNYSGQQQFPPSSTPAVYQLFNGLLNQKLREEDEKEQSSDGESYLSENSIGITLYSSSSNSSSSSGGGYRYFVHSNNHFPQNPLKY